MVVTGERHPEPRTDTAATPGEDSTPPPADHPQLTHEPALDGLRGIAVVLVVLFHLGRLDGGFLGVDLFFLLSGFLITSLLLVEQNQTGSINLGRFWARRVRRLLPAVFMLVAGVAVLMLRFTPADQRPDFRGDGLATLGYVANWHAMLADSSYADMFDQGQASPFDHAWSLAIEEQFYLLWPLVFLGAILVGRKLLDRSRTAAAAATADGNGQAAGRAFGGLSSTALTVGVLSLGGALVAFTLLAALFEEFGTNTNRAYFGTDTRIGPTLLGAALAAFTVHRPRRDRPPAPWSELAAIVAMAAMAWSMIHSGPDWLGKHLSVETQGYYRGGLLAFTLAAVVVILAVTRGPLGVVGRVLASPPLRALGLISYGLYLWHWPVIVYVDPTQRDTDLLPAPGWELDALRVALSLGLAVASYFLVEMPIRRGKVKGNAMWLGGFATAAVVVVIVLVSTSGNTTAETDNPLEQSGEVILPDLDAYPDDAPRVLLVGDSGALVLGPQLRAYGEEQGVAVGTATDPTCTIVYPEGVVRHGDDASTEDHGQCHDERWSDWEEAIADFQPDVVVYYLGNAGMVEYQLDGDWVGDCDPAYEDYLAAGLTDEITSFEANGANTVLLTSPYIGTLDETSGPRTDCRNELYGALAADQATVEVLDLNGLVASGEAGEPNEVMVDWVHLSESGGRAVSEWLFPQILE